MPGWMRIWVLDSAKYLLRYSVNSDPKHWILNPTIPKKKNQFTHFFKKVFFLFLRTKKLEGDIPRVDGEEGEIVIYFY